MKKVYLKKILTIPAILAGMCLIGYTLLVLVYCIPRDKINTNVRASVENFIIEDSLYMPSSAYVDNFTDALMLLTASHPQIENAWKDSVNAFRFDQIPGNPVESLICMFGNTGSPTDGIEVIPYARYWHGYLVFLKPLLVFFDHSEIRDIMALVQLMVFMLVIMLLVKMKKDDYTVPILLLFIFMNPIAVMMTMQYNTVLLITFLALIIVLKMNQVWKNNLYRWLLFFLIIGGNTSFFDLLTFPLVTLGIPLTLWISLNYEENLKKNLFHVISCSFFWSMGYFGLWFGKWILASIITGTNVITNGFNMAKIWTSSLNMDGKVILWQVLQRQKKVLLDNVAVRIMILLIMIYFLAMIVKKLIRLDINLLITYCVIACYPICWDFIIKNHSYTHFWFTYRELVITAFAITMLLVKGRERKLDN